jgi:hypothetical protein
VVAVVLVLLIASTLLVALLASLVELQVKEVAATETVVLLQLVETMAQATARVVTLIAGLLIHVHKRVATVS